MKSYRLNIIYLSVLSLCANITMAQWGSIDYDNETDSYDEIYLEDHQEIVTEEVGTPLATGSDDYRSRYQSSTFDYNDFEPEPKETRSNPSQKRNIDISGALGIIFKLILVLAGAFLLFILYRVISDFSYAKKHKLDKAEAAPISQSTEDLEEEIDRESLTFLIKDAKSNGNYTLAIRYYFLLYLEKLQEKNILVYHREKTNSDYLSEIKDTSRSTQFLKVSYLFEYAWYGKKAISESDFNGIETIFKEQISSVK